MLWPDFNEQEFTKALIHYTNRDRRYGNAIDYVPTGGTSVDVGEQSAARIVEGEKNKAEAKHA